MPMNAQELIQASKYDDLMTAPKIAIAGGGTLMDWANINFYKESNEKLKKISDPNRVVFMGNSITTVSYTHLTLPTILLV